jgi:hypothetical protein
MKRMWGVIAACVAMVALAGGCASNKALQLTGDFTADEFLPGVNTVDSGEIELTAGKFDGSTNDLVFTEPFSTTQLLIQDTTVFTSGQQIYDTDGDGNLDYIVLTLRALSAQAADSVEALGPGGATVPGATFYKIGGIAILPPDASVNLAASVTVPVNAFADPAAGDTFQLYKWNGTYTGPAGGSLRSPGRWEYVKDVTVDSTGNTVTFTTTTFGEYAVVASTVTVPTT